MHTKLDVYFCITIIGSIPLLEQTSQRKALQHICTVLIRILMYHLESLVKISFAQNSKSARYVYYVYTYSNSENQMLSTLCWLTLEYRRSHVQFAQMYIFNNQEYTSVRRLQPTHTNQEHQLFDPTVSNSVLLQLFLPQNNTSLECTPCHHTVQTQCRHIYCTAAVHLFISYNPYLFNLCTAPIFSSFFSLRLNSYPFYYFVSDMHIPIIILKY